MRAPIKAAKTFVRFIKMRRRLIHMRSRKPISLDAYEKMADSYAKKVETQPHNAYLERPTTLSLLPNLAGKLVLEAGCGPGHNTEWLLNLGHLIMLLI